MWAPLITSRGFIVVRSFSYPARIYHKKINIEGGKSQLQIYDDK